MGSAKSTNILHAKTLNDGFGPGSPSAGKGNGEIWGASLCPDSIDIQINHEIKRGLHGPLKWIHHVLLLFGFMRPAYEGGLSSLVLGASPTFTREMIGALSEKAVQVDPSAAAIDVGERDRLEKWTVEMMRAGRLELSKIDAPQYHMAYWYLKKFFPFNNPFSYFPTLFPFINSGSRLRLWLRDPTHAI